jgi:hypothetical protein
MIDPTECLRTGIFYSKIPYPQAGDPSACILIYTATPIEIDSWPITAKDILSYIKYDFLVVIYNVKAYI